MSVQQRSVTLRIFIASHFIFNWIRRSNQVKRIILILLMSGLSGCGSLNTLSKTDQTLALNLKRQNTYCESIPRVYSGLAYDFCHLHSNPGGIYLDWVLGFYLIDGVASTLVDTVLLPYSGYRQYRDGNLKIQRASLIGG